MEKRIKLAILDDKNHLTKILPMLMEVDIDYYSNPRDLYSGDFFKEEYNLYLIDYELGDNIYGSDIAKTLLGAKPNANILGISFNSEISVATNFIIAGANGFIRKNSDYQEYSEAIHAVSKGGFYFDLTKGLDISKLTKRELQVYLLKLLSIDTNEILKGLNIKRSSLYTILSNANKKISVSPVNGF